MIGQAHLHGSHVLPSDVSRCQPCAHGYDLPDVDAAAIRQAEPRAFTQVIASWVYEQDGPGGKPVAGVRFDSRHGDGLGIWAVFECPGDRDNSPRTTVVEHGPVQPDDPDIMEAMRIHRLRWSC